MSVAMYAVGRAAETCRRDPSLSQAEVRRLLVQLCTAATFNHARSSHALTSAICRQRSLGSAKRVERSVAQTIEGVRALSSAPLSAATISHMGFVQGGDHFMTTATTS